MVMVHHAWEWPSSSTLITAGAPTALKISPTAFSTSSNLEALDPEYRQCYYDVSEKQLCKLHDRIYIFEVRSS